MTKILHEVPTGNTVVPPRRRVLVVRPGALGDTILTVPLLHSLAARHPGGEITLLGTRAYADLRPRGVLFQAADGTDWTWLFGDAPVSVPAEYRAYDLAYLVLKRPEAVIANLARTGMDRVKWVSSVPESGMHMVEHLHRGLGLASPSRAPCLSHLGRGPNQDLIWMHPGSGGPAKCAPLEAFVSLARQLRIATGWEIAVTVGEDDGFLFAQESWKELVALPGLTVVEHQPLRVLVPRLGGARLFVGNDSGISHLAGGLGIPAGVFFVTTDPAQWAPWVPHDRLRIVDVTREGVAFHRLGWLVSELLQMASGE